MLDTTVTELIGITIVTVLFAVWLIIKSGGFDDDC